MNPFTNHIGYQVTNVTFSLTCVYKETLVGPACWGYTCQPYHSFIINIITVAKSSQACQAQWPQYLRWRPGALL